GVSAGCAVTQKERRASSSRRHILVVLLTVVSLLGGTGVANAYWSTQSAHIGTSTADVAFPMPTTSCSTSGLLIQSATVTWSESAGATAYDVRYTTTNGTTAPTRVS